MERVVTWTTGDGRVAKVTVTLVTSKVLDADGDKITVPCCDMVITATINGTLVGYGYPQAVNHPAAVGKIGNLGIVAANMAKIEAAVNEIKATPEWQDKERRAEISDQVRREYDAHRAMMDKVMAE